MRVGRWQAERMTTTETSDWIGPPAVLAAIVTTMAGASIADNPIEPHTTLGVIGLLAVPAGTLLGYAGLVVCLIATCAAVRSPQRSRLRGVIAWNACPLVIASLVGAGAALTVH